MRIKHQYTKDLQAKGWRANEVAARWGLRPEAISRIAKNPTQRDLDALAGLPNKSSKKD